LNKIEQRQKLINLSDYVKNQPKKMKVEKAKEMLRREVDIGGRYDMIELNEPLQSVIDPNVLCKGIIPG